MLRILTYRKTKYCEKVERHDYQLYLAINDIDHTKTKARDPQTNYNCERFYQVTFRENVLRQNANRNITRWKINLTGTEKWVTVRSSLSYYR